MANHIPTYAELDAQRRQLPKLSRAAMARRAGISESTITKGIKDGRAPSKPIRRQIELVLEAARAMAEAGL